MGLLKQGKMAIFWRNNDEFWHVQEGLGEVWLDIGAGSGALMNLENAR